MIERFKEALYDDKSIIKLTGKKVASSMNGVISIAHELFAQVNEEIRDQGKTNAIAKCMDYILVDSGVNALVGSSKDDTDRKIYMEYTNSEGIRYKCIFDGIEVAWEGDVPKGSAGYLPFFLYALAYDLSPIDIMGTKGVVKYSEKELRDLYLSIVDEYKNDKSKAVSRINMTKLCDAFYYGYGNLFAYCNVSKNNGNVSQQALQGKTSGYYHYMKELEMVSEKPMLDALKNESKAFISKSFVSGNAEVTYDNCLNGECILPYHWSPVVEGYIPDIEMLNNYFPVPQYMRILKKIRYRMNRIMARMDTPGIKNVIGKDYLNITLTGKPGTGKTVLIYNIAAALGMPVCSVNLSKNTDEDTFQGMNKIINGQMGFVETEFLQIYQNGGIIILEEVNLCDPAVTMGALGQAIEYPFVLKKDGYETVHRHPMCIIFSTKNINTFGSRGVNQAFSNRFPNSYILDDPTDEDFMNILEKNAFDKASCKKVLTAYKRITAYLTSTQVNDEEAILSLSLRTCIAALQTMEEGVSYKDALRDTFIGKIAETDGELAKGTEKAVVNVLPG